MSNVGQRESATQQRVVQFFQVELGYRYRRNWQYREGNATVDVSILTDWLRSRGVSEALIGRAIRQLDTAAALGEGKKLYQANKGALRLVIVVDKLLTGFDAPSAPYTYFDKQMADHNLFQAICRVNRLDGDSKDNGYIVDYKDLFRSLNKGIPDAVMLEHGVSVFEG